LALIDALPRLRTSAGKPLQARVGLATGTVVIGDLIGEGLAQEQAVVGETPNLAARLQTFAQPGMVLASASTRRLAGGHFEYRDLGAVALKGWDEPVPVWQILKESGVESRFEAQHKSELPPLVGREEEIELLCRRWQTIQRGEGRVVMLMGEPGIGKSRITLALEERLQSESHFTVRHFCSAHHTNSVLFPFISNLERAARFERADSPAEKLSKLQAVLARSAALTAQEMAALADLLSLPAGEQFRLQELTPQKRKELVFSAFFAHMRGLAARRPVLLLFEDLHWIDPTSLELLGLGVERLTELRALLVFTARPEFVPPWPGHAHITMVSLARLGRRDGAALIQQVTSGKLLPSDVMDQILARTDGVPLFVEELTKTVLESGLLQERDDRYVAERPLASLAIPATLHASLMARLDRLAPVREVAQLGAVIGREFSYEMLQAVSGLQPQQLDDALDQLVESELVFRRGAPPAAVYFFKHALVRDAAYASLLKGRRVQMHGAIASALEQHFADIVETQPELLAHHLSEAGAIDRAVRYWLRAGRNAAARSANLEAIAHLQRGIDVLERYQAGSERDRLELDLRLVLGPCLIATHGPASLKTVASFARCRELCERLGDLPEYLQVLFWLATVSVIRGELPQAQEAVSALLDRAEARGDSKALLNAVRGQAMIFLFMGRLVEAREMGERAFKAFSAADEETRLAARAAGQDAGVAGLAVLSWALWLLGFVDLAVERAEAALQRADMIEHPHSCAYAAYYASVLYGLRGECAIALKHAERCLSLSEQHGFRQWLGLSRAIIGVCRTMLTVECTPSDELAQALEQYRQAGHQVGVTAIAVLLIPALLRRRETELALEIVDRALATVVRNSERMFEAELFRLKAEILLALGAPEAEAQATTLLERALAAARCQQARSIELRAARDMALLLLDQNKQADGRELLAPIVGWFTEGLKMPEIREARAVLDRLR
ncbi:MAG: AAA family ATPase, partial [Solirubrobacterales bacterium]|nr:AAA family ATPase [Solirubrobacterales bacterium]